MQHKRENATDLPFSERYNEDVSQSSDSGLSEEGSAVAATTSDVDYHIPDVDQDLNSFESSFRGASLSDEPTAENEAYHKKWAKAQRKLLKKSIKKDKKSSKLILSVVKTASKMEHLLTTLPIDAPSDSLAKHMLQHEKVLEKLSKHLKEGKASNLGKSISIGLLRAIDSYQDPYDWIHKNILNEFSKANDALRGTLASYGVFNASLQHHLLYGSVNDAIRPSIGACSETGADMIVDPSLVCHFPEAQGNLEAQSLSDVVSNRNS